MSRKYRSIIAILLCIIMIVTTIRIQPFNEVSAYSNGLMVDNINDYINTYFTNNIEITIDISNHWENGYNAIVSLTNITDKK